MLKNIFLLLILLTLLFSGCNEKTPEPTPTPVTESSYSSIAPLDRGRKVAVEVSLKQDEELVTMDIKVSVKNYTVTLSGTVDTEEQKSRAEEITKAVKGVDKVINNLEVAK